MIRAEAITDSSWRELIAAIRSYVGRRVRDPADRDDLVQEVLLRVHRSRSDLKEPRSPGPWIYQIASNAVIDHWRRSGRPAARAMAGTEDDAALLPEIADDDGRLQETLAAYVAGRVARLPSPYRETLTLTELEGMKHQDAAQMLGVTLAAIKSRVLRGRALLRQALGECCALELGPTGQVVDCIPPAGAPRAETCRVPRASDT